MSSYRKTKTLSEGIDNLTDTFKPQMTSLIDILTLLLVFLIQSFNAEGTLVTQSPDLELPVSSSNKTPSPSLTIEVTRSDVVAEGKKLAAIDSFKSSKDMLIGNVFKWLVHEKARVTDTAAHKPIIIQCDKELEFNIVKRVLFTCSKAGYSDFSVLVVEE
jgi:Biopolymer transport protein ExbD/TolR.